MYICVRLKIILTQTTHRLTFYKPFTTISLKTFVNMSHFQSRRRQFGEPWDCLQPLIRIFGIITAFVICGVGVDVYLHGYEAGLFILDNYSKCLQCWSVCKCFGGSRLAFPYIAVGTALMLWPHNLWLSYVAGLLVILLAVLRFCLVFRFSNNSKDEGLLPQCDFEKIESGPDLPEEGFVEIGPSLEDEEPIDDVC